MMEAFMDLEYRDVIVGSAPPPPGVTPNFVNPEYRSGGIVPISAVFTILSTVFLVLRLYTKIGIVHLFGLEDVAIILAWAFSVLQTAIALNQQNLGQGRHIWDVPLESFKIYLKWGLASVIIYCPATMFSKVAILLFYRRISPKKTFRLIVGIVMAMVIGYNISLVLTFIFGCKPIAKAWDPLITTGSCVNTDALYLWNGILNIVTDIAVLALPIPMLVHLQMPGKQKIGLVAMFTVGSLACVASIVRLVYVARLLKDPDTTWAVVTATSWVVVEINLAVICGSLIVLKPLIRHHFPALLGGRSRYDSKQNYPKDASFYTHSNYKTKISSNSQSRPYPSVLLKGGRSALDSTLDDDVEAHSGEIELKGPSQPPRRSEQGLNEARGGHEGSRNESEDFIVPNAHTDGITRTVDIHVK